MSDPPELTEKDILTFQVQSYQYQTGITRIKTSEAINSMVEWVTSRQQEDHIANPEYPINKKENPWIEQKKCSIL